MTEEDDDLLVLDLDSLTIEDLEFIEEQTGDIEEFFHSFAAGKMPSPKKLRLLGFIIKRQTNPEFTMEMAGKLRVQLKKPDPTNGSARNGTKPSPRSATSTPRTRSKP